MCFTDDTRVEHVYITCDRTPLHWAYNVRLQDIHHFAKNYVQLIDVVGLVVTVTEHRSTRNEYSMMRDVVLLDKSMTFVRLTLRNEFAMRDGMHLLETLHQNNILFATGLKVDDFHGPYLSTCKKSKLYVNHSIRTYGIPEWFAKDENAQKLVTWNRTHGFSLPQALIISNARRIRINQFAFWTNYDWFMCKHCGREDVQTVTRYNAKMVVKDFTGSMKLLVKDTKAEFILQCVPSYLKKLMLKDNGAQMLKNYISQFNEYPYVFIIPAPKFGCVDHCAPVVTFVLKVDWKIENWQRDIGFIVIRAFLRH
ncbi:uncharacterized protein LOC131321304 [Rhododendron vialii]|uniref:uncharacterized protein LOC131321304 n=1 Tax=Rhododendron vialii TaxID=182163 RepID=UPI00265E567B|nr:uncharacterized protein LOC131321304 [Rhododendron vialii]